MMKWNEIARRMNDSIIKVDVTASDKEYFLATHVPFQNVEIIAGGHNVSEKSKTLSETEIYEKFLAKSEKKHQLIVVRGDHGTGKSNLICWLHSKLVSKGIDKTKEKVVFLRRLGNTTRGAIQQLISEGIVQDKDLLDKFQRFILSTDSKDEEEFKLSIYNAYIDKVASDKSREYFKPVICKDISSFLRDKRVLEYFLRDGGPIARCYRRITAKASDTCNYCIDGSDSIFKKEDFVFPNDISRKIIEEGAEEVRGFYRDELKDDEKYILKLVNYLNSFTSSVMQNCANITSENARDLFVNLRKNLKKEGKNLTVFIEDFTSFSMMEGELITALSAESGGEYSDLCNVCSFIGITNAYYDDTRFFHDNLKDRVSWQIIVTEKSYSSEDFLTELTAKYLNATYCDYEIIREWFKNGANEDILPNSGFFPDYDWDYVTINGIKLTLYPFNKISILNLYKRLQDKSPRKFLIHVIKQLFIDFAQDMDYKSEWSFPNFSPMIASSNVDPIYSSNIDKSNLNDEDKKRLKNLLSTWGNKTTVNDNKTIGGVSLDFLKEISLGNFEGLKETIKEYTQDNAETTSYLTNQTNFDIQETNLSRKEKEYQRKIDDINNWYENKDKLYYAQDFNAYLTDFVLSSIPWQDEGIPAFFVEDRQRTGVGYFIHIERSNLNTNIDKAVIILNCNSESRDVLIGLLNLNYLGSWIFDGAEYFQLVLTNWLEKNKYQIKKRVKGICLGNGEHPVFNWCLASEYLLALLLGVDLKSYDFFDTTRIIIKKFDIQNIENLKFEDKTSIRKRVIDYVVSYKPEFQKIHNWLLKGCNTNMGVLSKSNKVSDTPAFFCRVNELIKAYDYLEKRNWDIETELPDSKDVKWFGFGEAIKRIKELYVRIKQIAEEEQKMACNYFAELEAIIGNKPTVDYLKELCDNVSNFYRACNKANIGYLTELKMKFDKKDEFVEKIIYAYKKLSNITGYTNPIAILRELADNPFNKIESIVKDLKAMEKFANECIINQKSFSTNSEEINKNLENNTKSRLKKLIFRINSMEIENA